MQGWGIPQGLSVSSLADDAKVGSSHRVYTLGVQYRGRRTADKVSKEVELDGSEALHAAAELLLLRRYYYYVTAATEKGSVGTKMSDASELPLQLQQQLPRVSLNTAEIQYNSKITRVGIKCERSSHWCNLAAILFFLPAIATFDLYAFDVSSDWRNICTVHALNPTRQVTSLHSTLKLVIFPFFLHTMDHGK